MAAVITVPRRGWSMEEGTFAGWLKKEGERVRAGELLFVLESDKAAEEIESIDGGILHIPPEAPKAGDKVKVGQILAYLVAEGEAAPSGGQAPRAEQKHAPQAVPSQAGPEVRQLARTLGVDLAGVAGSGPGGRITAADVRRKHGAPTPARASAASTLERRPASSPRARRLAAQLGIDWSGLRGSGRDGRIRERDVQAAAAKKPAGKLILHTTIRRTIAARMVAGVTQAAPVTLTTRADATNLVNLRRQFRTTASANEEVPGYTDLVLKLTAVALERHPLLQARWQEEGLLVPERIDIAFAVDTDAGLLVPVIRDANKLTLRQISALSRDLAMGARAGRLTAEQMSDATFTLTNLGAFGVDAFTPVIHLPQCAVLGVGRIVREPALVEDRVVPREWMTLSLTFDHRVVDGAPAARFLDTVRGFLEQPAPWLIG
jgi:pyruvate dehydrogenase E2 component (dihydrolipoamide acetyltransferase)